MVYFFLLKASASHYLRTSQRPLSVLQDHGHTPQDLLSPLLLSIRLIKRVKVQYNSVGNMMQLLREERNYTPKKLQNSTKIYLQRQGNSCGFR